MQAGGSLPLHIVHILEDLKSFYKQVDILISTN